MEKRGEEKRKSRWPGGVENFGKLPLWPTITGVFQTLTSGELMTYCCLVQSASSKDREAIGIFKGEAFPKLTTLSSWSGLHERTVKRAVKELERKGVLGKRKVKLKNGRMKTVFKILTHDEYLKRVQVTPAPPVG